MWSPAVLALILPSFTGAANEQSVQQIK